MHREIIELHGGQHTIDSERGAGTIVMIRVPLKRHKESSFFVKQQTAFSYYVNNRNDRSCGNQEGQPVIA
ncbi:MAG: hypothetical protein ACQEXQ_27475 [Bacillota bacterium]